MNGICCNALRIINKYLPPKKIAHSLRVAQYALEDYDFYEYPVIKSGEDVFVTAILHDVVEDSECTFEDLKREGISDHCISWLKELTKEDDEEYLHYIERVGNGSVMAVIIKRADMKDHLLLKDTLTDKLKNKYLPAIPYIL